MNNEEYEYSCEDDSFIIACPKCDKKFKTNIDWMPRAHYAATILSKSGIDSLIEWEAWGKANNKRCLFCCPECDCYFDMSYRGFDRYHTKGFTIHFGDVKVFED